jgi:hypothetical protein
MSGVPSSDSFCSSGKNTTRDLQRFEWAFAWAIGQSFGPWAYHHGLRTDEAEWCDECRATWQLGEEIASIEREGDT